MQVAAANPSYLNESDVPEDVLAKEKDGKTPAGFPV